MDWYEQTGVQPRRGWDEGQMQRLVYGIMNGGSLEALSLQIGKSEQATRSALTSVKVDLHRALLPSIPNHNAPWDEVQEAALEASFRSHADLADVVRDAGRTAGGVLGRLQRLGLVVLVGDTYHRTKKDGCPGKALGYTWNDHTRLELMVYGIPGEQALSESDDGACRRDKPGAI